MYSWDSYEEMTAELLAEGCLTDIQHDEENGTIVTFNMEILELKYPEIAEAVKEEQLKEVDETLRSLVDKGMLEMSFRETEDGGIEAVYSLTEIGRQYAETFLT